MKKIFGFAVAMSCVAATTAYATPFNAVADFGSAPWSYGTESSSIFTAFSHSDSQSFSGNSYIIASDTENIQQGPYVIKNTSGATFSIPDPIPAIFSNSALTMATGFAGSTNVRWTAPVAGFYLISGSFTDAEASNVDLSVEVAGADMFTGGFLGSGSYQGVEDFSFTVGVAAGDTVDFLVNGLNNPSNDEVALVAQISDVPEPDTVRLLGAALLLIGIIKILAPQLKKHVYQGLTS